MMDNGVLHTHWLDDMVESVASTLGGRIGNMGPIPSLRFFPHPPVPYGAPPVLNPFNPTTGFDVKMGKGDTLMCEWFLRSPKIKNGSFE